MFIFDEGYVVVDHLCTDMQCVLIPPPSFECYAAVQRLAVGSSSPGRMRFRLALFTSYNPVALLE